jgi:hypothetical protein
MTTKQKTLIGALIALVILAIVLVVMNNNRKQAAIDAKYADEHATGGTGVNGGGTDPNGPPNPFSLGLQTWELILEAIRKKKAAKLNVSTNSVTVSKAEVMDEIQNNPSIMLT